MAEVFLDEEESKEELEFKDDILNYRGYFVENEDEEEKKFYEYGAHFPYMYLYQRLEILAQERKKTQNSLERKLKAKERLNNKDPKEDPATHEESKPNDNLKDLLSIFQQKGKSRNRGDVDIGLTYMPQMNKKKEEQINEIENAAIALIKSTAGKKDEKKNGIKNIKKNGILKNEEINGANLKYNNYMNKKEKIDNKKTTKKPKSGNQQTKIRKRNDNKIWNINNSLNGNITISLNLLNKTKFAEKNNPKNMTHDIPYMTKITNNLVNKLKSIQYSKEKIRKQILNTGNADQNILKRTKQNKIINKFRNKNNKGSYSNYYGYQNTKNTSSSKNLLNTNNNNKKNRINKIGISSTVNQINEKLDKKNNSNMKNNIINHNNINNNMNNKHIKQNNFLSNLKNNTKSKNIYNINKNLLKKNNINSKNNISINNNINQNNNTNNQNNKNKIPNNNVKNILIKKENIKSSTLNRNQFEFIENLGNKKAKNNISRNNNIPIFNNQIQSITNKNFHSVNNPNKKIMNKLKPNHVNINLTNNFNNLNQQIKPQNSNKIKEINYKFNKNCASNINLKKYSPGKVSHQKVEIQKAKNINNIQEKLKNYLLKANDIKNNINLNKNKKRENKSSNKNNAFINLENNTNKKKNIISRNREDNNNINLEKLKSKKNNTLMQNKKKHHININININNQQNIILNKLGNGANNNSINICSVRSSDNKEINNNLVDKNQKIDGNYFV